MGSYAEKDKIVLLFDNYGPDSRKLHTSFKIAGKEYPVVVIGDDGFLPEGVISVYEYFLGDFKNAKNIPGKPRYFNQITVPEFWEISGNNASGKVHNLNKERARIFYTEPKHKRLVKVVDWYDDKGVVRASDHYNKYGALYARTIFNKKGQRVNKSYFSVEGKEILMENFVTNDIILNDGELVKIFHTKKEFVAYVLEKAGYAQHRLFFNTLATPFFVSQYLPGNDKGDVLFWQEPTGDAIPGNMQMILNGVATRTAKIMVQKKESYEKLLQLGASCDMVHKLGYIYSFQKENKNRPEALICTNSDRIEQCEHLVQALPEVHFSIVALTEMSSKLMSMDKYENVSLYPGVKMKVLDELFEKCDYYLDINYEAEIVSAVQLAFLHNQLIFGFKETLHNPGYVAAEHIFAAAEVQKLIDCLKSALTDENVMKEHMKKQYEWAMQETADAYLSI